MKATQEKSRHEEERAKPKQEVEQSVEEIRKKKIRAEEAGVEQNEGKTSDWVLKLAYFA